MLRQGNDHSATDWLGVLEPVVERYQLFIPAYNPGNFLRRLVLPWPIKDCSLRSLQSKLIKMGGRMVHHARRIIFQLSEAFR
jgi:hypothetical protein